MPSNINPTNINGNYPVAGQDNDSQGFRDNFTNIKNNLQFSKIEIDDLQSKVLLKNPLIGTTLNNDMNYSVIYRSQNKASASTFRDLGIINGSVSVSFLDALVQKVTTSSAVSNPLAINLGDFPPTGISGSLRLWVRINFSVGQTSAGIKFPNNVNLGVSALSNYDDSTKTKTFTSTGDYLFEFFTVDGGLNFWVLQLV
jgi:hypothetical protein